MHILGWIDGWGARRHVLNGLELVVDVQLAEGRFGCGFVKEGTIFLVAVDPSVQSCFLFVGSMKNP